jgi:hypothetical protein
MQKHFMSPVTALTVLDSRHAYGVASPLRKAHAKLRWDHGSSILEFLARNVRYVVHSANFRL